MKKRAHQAEERAKMNFRKSIFPACAMLALALTMVWGAATPADAQQTTIRNDARIVGQGYREFRLSVDSPAACRSACAADTRCRGFTYYRPWTRGSARAVCRLTDRAPQVVNDRCCVAGRTRAAPPVRPNMAAVGVWRVTRGGQRLCRIGLSRRAEGRRFRARVRGPECAALRLNRVASWWARGKQLYLFASNGTLRLTLVRETGKERYKAKRVSLMRMRRAPVAWTYPPTLLGTWQFGFKGGWRCDLVLANDPVRAHDARKASGCGKVAAYWRYQNGTLHVLDRRGRVRAVLIRTNRFLWRSRRQAGTRESYLKRKPTGPSWPVAAKTLGKWTYGLEGTTWRCELLLTKLDARKLDARKASGCGTVAAYWRMRAGKLEILNAAGGVRAVLARINENHWRGKRPRDNRFRYLRRRPAGPDWAVPAGIVGKWRYGVLGAPARCTLSILKNNAGRHNARKLTGCGTIAAYWRFKNRRIAILDSLGRIRARLTRQASGEWRGVAAGGRNVLILRKPLPPEPRWRYPANLLGTWRYTELSSGRSCTMRLLRRGGRYDARVASGCQLAPRYWQYVGGKLYLYNQGGAIHTVLSKVFGGLWKGQAIFGGAPRVLRRVGP